MAHIHEKPRGGSRALGMAGGPISSVCFSAFHVLAHLCTGYNSRQAFLRGDRGGQWHLPASIVFRASDPKNKEEHHSKNSTPVTRNDVIDLAWVTYPFPEAVAPSRRIPTGTI